MLVDQAFQKAYFVAHRVLRAWWLVRNPRTRGALVAVWCGDELLVIRNSYRTPLTLPGGYVRPSETPEQAAARELLEELGIACTPDELELVYSGEHPFEFRRDFVWILEVTLSERPDIRVDNREVVWAAFTKPEELLHRNIVPHLREYLQARAGRAAGQEHL